MAKLPPCDRSDLIRKLKKLGFEGPYPGGRHSYMKRGGYRQINPNPHGGQIDSVPPCVRRERAGAPGIDGAAYRCPRASKFRRMAYSE